MLEPVLFLLILAWLARWVAQGWSGRGNPELQAQHTAEVARLRDEVDQLQQQVTRLSDEQAFLTQLLASGKQAAPALPAPETAPEPTDPESH